MSIIKYQELSGYLRYQELFRPHPTLGLGPEAVARPLQQVKLAETGEAQGDGDLVAWCTNLLAVLALLACTKSRSQFAYSRQSCIEKIKAWVLRSFLFGSADRNVTSLMGNARVKDPGLCTDEFAYPLALPAHVHTLCHIFVQAPRVNEYESLAFASDLS